MKSNAGIVAGGGWFERKIVAKSKARFFGFLSAIWLVLTALAAIFLGASSELSPSSIWLCWATIVLEFVFVALAIWFSFREPASEVTDRVPNPDYDPNKFY